MKYFFSVLIFFTLCLYNSIFLNAQVITSIPVFPQDSDSIQIIFNSKEGSGGLATYIGDVYAHTGVITNLSTSIADWKYVKTNWGLNTPETKLTKIGDNLYSLKLKPSVRSFFGVPATEEIRKVGFVFRSAIPSAGSYLEGKMAGGGDIFLTIFKAGLQVAINKPDLGYYLLNLNDSLNVKVDALNADSVFLYFNNILVRHEAGDTIHQKIIALQDGKFWIKAVAKNLTATASDSFYFIVKKPQIIQSLPAGIKEGVNYLDSQKVVLCLYAPQKKNVYVIGDFTNWQLDTLFFMKQTPDSNYFWIEVGNLLPHKEYIYQYLVDDKILIADPYSEKLSDPWNDPYINSATYPNMLSYPKDKTQGMASVLQTAQSKYVWKNTNFTPSARSKLVIYELLIRDFTAKHTFQCLIDSIQYLKNLGINALELMPVNEFEGNSSWGYNTSFYFAVDKYYGPKNDFKKLIDTCHKLGIAVIMDIVLNHSFGSSPYVKLYWDDINNRPSANSPFFNPVAKHDYNVGYDMNHESKSVKKYASNVLKFWLNEYHVDGFRFDLSKGFTQKNTLGNTSNWGMYDPSRISILSDYADTIKSVNNNAFVILEHFADNVEEKELSNKGMMLWGNSNSSYAEAAMGYNTSSKSDFSYVSYQTRGWSNPNLVGYMESHDEERIMYKCLQWGNQSGSYNTKTIPTALIRSRMNSLFFIPIPGPKLIWQFGELGYDFNIDLNGRTGEKPIRWDYFADKNRNELYQFYSTINHLKQNEPLFSTTNYKISVASSLKQITFNSSNLNALIVGNFDVESSENVLQFQHTGTWYDYLNADSVVVTDLQAKYVLSAGEYHLYFDSRKTNNDFKDFTWAKKISPQSGICMVYPCPAADQVHIVINSKIKSDVALEIFTVSGRKVAEINLEKVDYLGFSLSDYGITLFRGLYFVKVKSDSSSQTIKLIIL